MLVYRSALLVLLVCLVFPACALASNLAEALFRDRIMKKENDYIRKQLSTESVQHTEDCQLNSMMETNRTAYYYEIKPGQTLSSIIEEVLGSKNYMEIALDYHNNHYVQAGEQFSKIDEQEKTIKAGESLLIPSCQYVNEHSDTHNGMKPPCRTHLPDKLKMILLKSDSQFTSSENHFVGKINTGRVFRPAIRSAFDCGRQRGLIANIEIEINDSIDIVDSICLDLNDIDIALIGRYVNSHERNSGSCKCRENAFERCADNQLESILSEPFYLGKDAIVIVYNNRNPILDGNPEFTDLQFDRSNTPDISELLYGVEFWEEFVDVGTPDYERDRDQQANDENKDVTYSRIERYYPEKESVLFHFIVDYINHLQGNKERHIEPNDMIPLGSKIDDLTFFSNFGGFILEMIEERELGIGVVSYADFVAHKEKRRESQLESKVDMFSINGHGLQGSEEANIEYHIRRPISLYGTVNKFSGDESRERICRLLSHLGSEFDVFGEDRPSSFVRKLGFFNLNHDEKTQSKKNFEKLCK